MNNSFLISGASKGHTAHFGKLFFLMKNKIAGQTPNFNVRCTVETEGVPKTAKPAKRKTMWPFFKACCHAALIFQLFYSSLVSKIKALVLC